MYNKRDDGWVGCNTGLTGVCRTEAQRIDNVFEGMLSPRFSPEISRRAILCTTNENSIHLNNTIINQFHGDMRTFVSVDTIEDDTNGGMGARYPVEYLNSIISSGLPPHELILKRGVPVILIRNLNVAGKLCNGTKLIVTRIFSNWIEALPVDSNVPVLLHRMSITDVNPDLPFRLTRLQIPVRVCFSMTFNKCQGLTYDRIGLKLFPEIFAHGQLYVGMSRVRSINGLSVYSGEIEPDKSVIDVITKNVVYTEVLS